MPLRLKKNGANFAIEKFQFLGNLCQCCAANMLQPRQVSCNLTKQHEPASWSLKMLAMP